VNKMLISTIESRPFFVFCLVLLHIILFGIPMMLGVFILVTYFQLTHNVAMSITLTIIACVVHFTFINIKSSITFYDDITKHIQIE